MNTTNTTFNSSLKYYFGIFVMGILFSVNALAQAPKVNINAQPQKLEVKKGDKFNIKISINLPSPWYTYDLQEQLNADDIGPSPTEITFAPNTAMETSGKVQTSKPLKKWDAGFEMDVLYFKSAFTFTVPVTAKKDINFAKDKIEVLLYMQLCNETGCLPPDDYKAFISNKPFEDKTDTVSADTTQTVAADTALATNTTPTVAPAPAQGTQMTESQMEIEAKKKEGIWSFLWFAMVAGALSLLTPCVFPMIPITVSFFTKRAEKAGSSTVKDAFIYAIGIMLTFTGLGILLASVFGATGIRDFAANGWINLFIAAIFIIFALNLFGSFEIQLPSGLMNKLNTKSNQGSGIISVLLMALTFSITSFTCTVPFVGSTLIAASGGDWFEPIIGMIGFSGVFAAPFFLLALFPTVMKKMPKAGGWMNNVKVVMGFVEIAAAIKFISNADLVWNWGVLPKELFLAIWVAICLLIVLYILGVFRLHHDSKVEGLKASRVIWSIFFGAVAFYFLTGMFGKTLGEMDAFLPPAEYRELMNSGDISAENMANTANLSSSTQGQQGVQDIWLKNYEEGLKMAKSSGKPLFIDFTGFTCTNCRWMEQNMFKRGEISARMNEFVKVKLFTDRREEPYTSNKKLQQEQYGSIELPLYVIISPDGQHIGTKTFTRDMNEFIEFLDKGISSKKTQ